MALYLASALVFVRSLGDRGQVQTQKQTIRQTDKLNRQTDKQNPHTDTKINRQTDKQTLKQTY